jgi:hypothetical protein
MLSAYAVNIIFNFNFQGAEYEKGERFYYGAGFGGGVGGL